MIPCLKGAIVRDPELDVIVEALIEAVDCMEITLECNTVPKGYEFKYSAKEKKQVQEWRDRLKRYRSMLNTVRRCRRKKARG